MLGMREAVGVGDSPLFLSYSEAIVASGGLSTSPVPKVVPRRCYPERAPGTDDC